MNTIYTFGYGNRPNYDVLQECLTRHQIKYLIDVRFKPVGWSRIWHSASLKKFCEGLGVQYASEPSLGNTSGKAEWIPPDTHRAALSLLEIKEILREGSVVLMCSELDYRRCHRTDVANALVQIAGSSVVHLS